MSRHLKISVPLEHVKNLADYLDIDPGEVEDAVLREFVRDACAARLERLAERKSVRVTLQNILDVGQRKVAINLTPEQRDRVRREYSNRPKVGDHVH